MLLMAHAKRKSRAHNVWCNTQCKSVPVMLLINPVLQQVDQAWHYIANISFRLFRKHNL